MLRIDAGADAAQMVKCESVWDGADKQLICDTMSHCWLSPPSKRAVAASSMRSRVPEPAGSRGVTLGDLLEKALDDRASPNSNRLVRKDAGDRAAVMRCAQVAAPDRAGAVLDATHLIGHARGAEARHTAVLSTPPSRLTGLDEKGRLAVSALARDTLILHQITPGATPPAVHSSAGASCVNCTIRRAP